MQNDDKSPYPDLDNAAPLDPLKATPPEPIAEDRGEPTTKAPKKRKPVIVVVVVVLVVAALSAVGMFGLFLYRTIEAKKAAAVVNVADDPALANRSSTGPDLGKYQAEIAAALEADKKAKALEEQQRSAQADPVKTDSKPKSTPQPSLGQYGGNQSGSTGSNGKPVLTPAQAAAKRRLEGDVMWAESGVGGSSGSSSGGQGSQRGQSNGSSGAGHSDDLADNSGSSSGGLGGSGSGGGSQSSSIGGSLRTEEYPMGIVGRPRSLKYLLMHGTSIPCNNIERIVTNYAGKLRCTIDRDVYSADGSVLLIGKGSFAEGERKVAMKQGVAKVFVAWGTIETEDGIPVRIDSLAADSLGGAGIDAWIDNHYPERFGGAIALSLLDDVFSALANSTQKSDSNTNISFDNTSDNASDMASIALENSINIPPTGYVNQAKETTILIARDIDFSTVYGVE